MLDKDLYNSQLSKHYQLLGAFVEMDKEYKNLKKELTHHKRMSKKQVGFADEGAKPSPSPPATADPPKPPPPPPRDEPRAVEEAPAAASEAPAGSASSDPPPP
mmetsp:Transcript_21556/g.63624  ORF Transcript_21556/g.63624 Transcript_21556/m.63624 type:complete len:103 (+) Transcript_21556:1144-1452(+)